ncbi:MAG: carbamoyl-phosphate synthase large subunit, partial [Elusimicrobia bacterium]|nr:carbamoyl-phosphate synthase large subunit [Elusimicrobiota bacterium]
RMREAAFRAYEALGISCGGSNVQFAVNPKDGSMVIIEINPRVSRSSALASKATGFPIAKIAAMLAVGMTLDEITNEITGKTPASFEPSIDYVVVKAPRFHFEKFPGADVTLNTQMKSIGETMGIGRNFLEALQKSLRSLEDGTRGLEAMEAGDQELSALMGKPNARRIFAIYTALARGWTIADVHQLCGVDPWFLNEIKKAADLAQGLKRAPRRINNMLGEAKRLGFSNEQLAALTGASVLKIADLSRVQNRSAVFYEVDTCAAEFEAQTPYYYSTFCSGSGTGPRSSTGDPRKKVIVLGSGPNRIGQGIEFDYVCVHAVEAIREEGLVSIMINSNPETVSTDYDTADRLYFEPLTFEDVARVADREKENLMGVLLGFGGQTPLNLAHRIADALGPRMVLGTPVAQIDASEDRSRFARLLKRLDLAHPKWVLAKDKKEAVRLVDRASRKIPFPVLVRPSYVLGGRGMRIFYDAAALKDHLTGLPEITERSSAIYMDEFLEDAMEIDVDVVGDGRNFSVCGVMEHIEEAGIHSGDSYCVWPPVTLTKRQQEDVEKAALILAKNLGVIGLLNIQFALHRGALHVLEANPRASRTVPFISKARSIPWAKIAAKACLGRALPDLIAPYRKQLESPPGFCAIKAPVFSWERFPGVDIILGPEMRSTGEMMCFGRTFAESFAKAQKALRGNLPSGKKTILFSLKHEDKSKFLGLAKRLAAAGFIIVATKNTARYFRDHGGIDVREVFKIDEGRPHVVDIIANGEVTLVVNTPSHQSKSREDGYAIRNEALLHGIAVVPTPRALEAVLSALNQNGHDPAFIYALQDLSPLNPKV